jgi:hypothetical protein
VLQIHETIPLQILDPFTELFEVGHTSSPDGSNAQIVAWVNEPSPRKSQSAPSRSVCCNYPPGAWKDRAPEWREAYDERRQGSTFRRASIIGNRILAPAAPIPDVTPSLERNLFLRDVVEFVLGNGAQGRNRTLAYPTENTTIF